MRRASRGDLQLDVSYAARKPWVPSERQFSRWVRAALPQRFRHAVVSICVVGAARSRSLNARYRGKDHATNVLSFAGPGASADGRDWLGELVICARVVAREARAQGMLPTAHWAHMTVHGLLHLQGFDHLRRLEAKKMQGIETEVLDKLGFSDPYA
jgi:probable rRNA maturation factor